MRIAIIGTGVSGLVAAYVLNRAHDITVFEAADAPGGHANTVSVQAGERTIGVDTGFVVFNESAYPNFVKLLEQLGVASQPSDMSFSVQCAGSRLEYASHSLGGVFAQPSNILKPSFHRMLHDIRRFFRDSREVLSNGHGTMTLGDYLQERRYSRAFVQNHLIPMGSAVWSAKPSQFADFPVRQFVRFFDNHGFLQVRNRPGWRTVTGGSHRYVDAITATFRDRLRLNTPVRGVRRTEQGVEMRTDKHGVEHFDDVVIATHSDQALRMLDDPSDEERRVLGAIRYQANDTVLHTDARLLPTRRNAWASWNYFKPADPQDSVSITYCMNRLQSIESADPFCVTLNRTPAIETSRIIRRMNYEHPVYDMSAFDAQGKHDRISGVRHTHYCGAYWGYGFHEDGVRNALRVCARFGLEL